MWFKVEWMKKAHTVFIKIDDGIYKILKNEDERFSGRCYVGTSDVLDILEFQDVLILDKDERILYASFEMQE